ncbi:tol-pal system protein YbgF [Gilliamella sp. Bif1-4]|jgi:tol-pal system protein YbgF|uniref:tol-pal system protein YbgF n=1 Tax=Gilliamella sp. Bif1-4 TaxID=3120233 RepID=UPI00080E4FEE|nr:tol-pal system protein YbgF [Gilliamella apicola]OCG38955.1 tol-pal system protein YbgF [Gilliamella apicola]
MHKKILTLLLFLLFTGCAASSSGIDQTVQAQGQLLIENQQKISELQADVDTLRGQLEETKYQLNQIIERQKMILQQMANSPGFSSNPNFDLQEEGYGSKTSSEPTLSKSSSDLSGWVTTGDDKADYNFIIRFVNDVKQNNEVIDAFKKHLKSYPKSSYRANVNYWLGQLLYKQSNKNDASFYYATVVKDFPSSSKAADSLYKVGLILLDKGDTKKAKTVFQQVVNKYPKDKNAVVLANKKLASLK